MPSLNSDTCMVGPGDFPGTSAHQGRCSPQFVDTGITSGEDSTMTNCQPLIVTPSMCTFRIQQLAVTKFWHTSHTINTDIDRPRHRNRRYTASGDHE